MVDVQAHLQSKTLRFDRKRFPGFGRKSTNRTFLFVTIFIFLLLRLAVNDTLFNVDELIAPAVVTGMFQRGDLNGNWILAVDIPAFFKVNQFNFYSYHLFSTPFYSADTDQFILNLRWVNLILQAVTLIVLLSCAARLEPTERNRIALVAMFVVAPAMVFDAHIARCESFLYLLFALQLWATLLHGRTFMRYALFGVLLGIGCASKITFILTGAILIPEIIATLRVDLRTVLGQIGLLVVAAVFGFVATSPYVVIDFHGFIAGVQALFNQYGTQHPPHSFLEASLARNITRTLLFVLLTTGSLIPLAMFQATRPPVKALGLALFGFLVIAYFATKPVFFERNIGIGLLALLVFVAVNIRNRVESLLIGASVVLMLFWSFNIAVIFGSKNIHQKSFERATFGAPVERVWPIDGLDSFLGTCQGIVGVRNYNDDFSREMIDDAKAVPIAHFTSVFAVLPTSTLHTYLESDLHYYRCRRQGTNQPPDAMTGTSIEDW